ncbi:MAG: GHKL domain-containing protein [Clostridium sp.]
MNRNYVPFSVISWKMHWMPAGTARTLHLFIRIRAREESGHIALAVDNTCGSAPIEENGQFRSTKHEGFGTGTASVRAIAQRHQGVAEFRHEDGIFYASVFI